MILLPLNNPCQTSQFHPVIAHGLIAVVRSFAFTFLRGRFLDVNRQKTQIEGYRTLAIAEVFGFLDTIILLYTIEASRLKLCLACLCFCIYFYY